MHDARYHPTQRSHEAGPRYGRGRAYGTTALFIAIVAALAFVLLGGALGVSVLDIDGYLRSLSL